MNNNLLNLFEVFQGVIIEAMILEIKKQGDIVSFNPAIRIDSPRDSDDFYEDITGLEYDKDEDYYYVHNFVTDTNLDVEEYWTPLRDMSFDELFRIAERL